jgi:hypothetical protein
MNRVPFLEDVRVHDLEWMVGNCAEDGTFAHLKCLRGNYRPVREAKGMIAVSLTLD